VDEVAGSSPVYAPMNLLTEQQFNVYEAKADIKLISNTPHEYHIPKGTKYYISDTLMIHYYPNRKQTQVWKIEAVKLTEVRTKKIGSLTCKPIDISY